MPPCSYIRPPSKRPGAVRGQFTGCGDDLAGHCRPSRCYRWKQLCWAGPAELLTKWATDLMTLLKRRRRADGSSSSSGSGGGGGEGSGGGRGSGDGARAVFSVSHPGLNLRPRYHQLVLYCASECHSINMLLFQHHSDHFYFYVPLQQFRGEKYVRI